MIVSAEGRKLNKKQPTSFLVFKQDRMKTDTVPMAKQHGTLR